MSQHTHTWPEIAIALFEQLTGKEAEIYYELQNFEIQVPSGTGPEAKHALWKMNGTLKITTKAKS